MTDEQTAAGTARLTRLWVDHKAAVEAFVWRRTGEDVDDVVQQVFVTAWRRLDDVPDEPRGWLLTVARNVLLNQQRAGRRRTALAVRVTSTIEVPTSSDAAPDDHDVLRAAWAKLTDDEREILALTAWDDLTAAEAAQVLGITRPACAMRLTRARRHLRELYAIESPTTPEGDPK